MQLKKAMALFVLVGSLGGVNGVAYADSPFDFKEMLKMKQMDKDKDGMVSKKEFMAMMEKAWDMKAKDMKAKDKKAKDGKMTETQMQDFWKDFNQAGS